MVIRIVAAAGACLAVTMLSGMPAAAHTQDKFATCGWHADELKLAGQKRRAFMKRCTADEDSPRGKTAPGRAPAGAPKPQ